jgi:hypothetical protein
MNKIITFIKALWFHVGAGMPKSDQQTIDQRFDICKSCEFFHQNQCLQCGCNISNKKIFLNKLAWLDQHCPIEKW